MVDGVLIKVLSWDNWGDDMLTELSLELSQLDIWSVLGADEDGVDTEWDHLAVLISVLDGDLGLSVWANPWAGSVLSDLSESVPELGGKAVGEWHTLLSLVGGIAEHMALVTSTNILNSFVLMDCTGNLWGLLLNLDIDFAGVVVTSLIDVVIADLLKGVTDNLNVVNLCLGGDLTKDQDHVGLGTGLTGNSGIWVLGKTGIEDSIRDLVTELVWMSFIHTLRGEDEVVFWNRENL
jgi:hypothetical protein